MKMSSVLLVLAVAAVTGCSDEQPVSASAENAAAPEAIPNSTSVPAAVTEACVSGKGYELLPEDVCLTGTQEFRDQRSYVDKQGRDRRRVTFSFTGGDAESVAQNLSKAFSSAGYSVRPQMETTDGSIQIPVTKKGLGTTYLSVKLPSGTANSEANGYFFIDFLVPETNKAISSAE